MTAGHTTARVRLVCRFGGGTGDTVLHADLSKQALGSVIDKLLAYRNRAELPTAHITIPEDGQPDRQVMVWRVVRVVGLPPFFGEDEALLYERGRPAEPMADDDQPDAVLVPLTRGQLEGVLAGEAVRVDIPAELYGPALAVIVRLKKEI